MAKGYARYPAPLPDVLKRITEASGFYTYEMEVIALCEHLRSSYGVMLSQEEYDGVCSLQAKFEYLTKDKQLPAVKEPSEID